MPIILQRVYDIPNIYNDDEKEIYKDLLGQFRLRVGDDIPSDNILYEKCSRYKDAQIIMFMNASLTDINGFGVPKTSYNLKQMYNTNNALLIMGAIVCMLVREGIFQASNQINFSDSGLSIGMYDKTGIYQGWYGILLQTYMQDKKTFKESVIMSSPGAGFVGIGSEFSYRGGY